jgi:hypothetical protein
LGHRLREWPRSFDASMRLDLLMVAVRGHRGRSQHQAAQGDYRFRG